MGGTEPLVCRCCPPSVAPTPGAQNFSVMQRAVPVALSTTLASRTLSLYTEAETEGVKHCTQDCSCSLLSSLLPSVTAVHYIYTVRIVSLLTVHQ